MCRPVGRFAGGRPPLAGFAGDGSPLISARVNSSMARKVAGSSQKPESSSQNCRVRALDWDLRRILDGRPLTSSVDMAFRSGTCFENARTVVPRSCSITSMNHITGSRTFLPIRFCITGRGIQRASTFSNPSRYVRGYHRVFDFVC
jgi:hypothetical protein